MIFIFIFIFIFVRLLESVIVIAFLYISGMINAAANRVYPDVKYRILEYFSLSYRLRIVFINIFVISFLRLKLIKLRHSL